MSLLDRTRAFARNRALTAADTWERHLVVAQFAGSPRQVFDVGGLPGQLASFLPGTAVIAGNIEPPADLLLERDGLPFRDRAIEVVTSLDALEHVPPPERLAFVADLVRVARRRLVLCCPLGTSEHERAEREIQAWHRELTGRDHPWLVEHLAHGLPTQADLERWLAQACADGDSWALRYHGDFRVTNEQFKLIVTARRRPTPAAVLSFAARRLTHRPDTELAEHAGRYTNRAFAVVDRSPA
jgi:hypothetical protein